MKTVIDFTADELPKVSFCAVVVYEECERGGGSIGDCAVSIGHGPTVDGLGRMDRGILVNRGRLVVSIASLHWADAIARSGNSKAAHPNTKVPAMLQSMSAGSNCRWESID